MRRLFRGKTGLAAAVLAATLLGGCRDLAVLEAFTPTATKYDGAWIGEMSVGLRQQECTLTRAGMRVRVEGGKLDGTARFASGIGEITGLIGEDGALRYADMRSQFAKNDAEFEGTFGDREASGTWANKVCRGQWVLRKAR
jgi:hypothetical protein